MTKKYKYSSYFTIPHACKDDRRIPFNKKAASLRRLFNV
ncbi:hypothetical protein GP5015_2096 [gamma proteobacterium HTCC5015]|nr:hypothetical protein GP5015_2096 [gamma proteobacterium HTCC5015]